MQYPHTYILIPYTPDRRKRALESVSSIWANTDTSLTPHSIVLYENDYIGFPNAILNMVEHIDGFVFLGSSDVIFGKDWLRTLWEKMEEHGRTSIVEPYNEIWKGQLIQHALMHSDVVKRYFHRHYFHYYCDNEMTERVLADGIHKFIYCPESLIEHRHFVNGKAEKDACYEVVMDPARNEKDRQTYLRRKAQGWPIE